MPTITVTPLNTILSWFQTDDFPTELQFANSWSSFWHKSDTIPVSSIEGLSQLFQQTASSEAFNTHLADSNAHAGFLAKLDATNLNASNVNAWRDRLGVGDIPDNVALVDVGASQSVYNKQQIDTLCMMLSDYVVSGKIRADKIEALGLTELITVTETSLSAFVANSANYTYEKNDFIAIPVNGSYSMYIFKGGDKSLSVNYIPTGLSNITIAMVQGLQTALDGKMDKPTASGNYMARYALGSVSWRAINPASNFLNFWNGNDFTASSLYFDGSKFGIGTTTPSETLHLNNGRLRTKSVVLDSNTETLPNQLTFDGDKLFGTSSTGVKRPVMYQDYAAELELWNSFTEVQKNNIKAVMNGGYTTNSMSVFMINPIVVQNTNSTQFMTLLGVNLNFNPSNFSVQIVTENSTTSNYTVVKTIDNSKVQLYPDGLSLVFYDDFNTYALGTYKIRLTNGIASYLTTVTFQVVPNLTPYNLTTLTWDTRVIRNETATGVITDINGIYAKSAYTNATQAEFNTGTTLGICISSSAFGSMADDFFLELAGFSEDIQYRRHYVGITNETAPILANNLLAGMGFNRVPGSTALYNSNTGVGITGSGTNLDRVYIIKRGNFMTTVVKGSNSIASAVFNVTTDVNTPVKFKMCLIAGDLFTVNNNLQIISAYKLN